MKIHYGLAASVINMTASAAVFPFPTGVIAKIIYHGHCLSGTCFTRQYNNQYQPFSLKDIGTVTFSLVFREYYVSEDKVNAQMRKQYFSTHIYTNTTVSVSTPDQVHQYVSNIDSNFNFFSPRKFEFNLPRYSRKSLFFYIFLSYYHTNVSTISKETIHTFLNVVFVLFLNTVLVFHKNEVSFLLG